MHIQFDLNESLSNHFPILAQEYAQILKFAQAHEIVLGNPETHQLLRLPYVIRGTPQYSKRLRSKLDDLSNQLARSQLRGIIFLVATIRPQADVWESLKLLSRWIPRLISKLQAQCSFKLRYLWFIEPTTAGIAHANLLLFHRFIPNLPKIAEWWGSHKFAEPQGLHWEYLPIHRGLKRVHHYAAKLGLLYGAKLQILENHGLDPQLVLGFLGMLNYSGKRGMSSSRGLFSRSIFCRKAGLVQADQTNSHDIQRPRWLYLGLIETSTISQLIQEGNFSFNYLIQFAPRWVQQEAGLDPP